MIHKKILASIAFAIKFARTKTCSAVENKTFIAENHRCTWNVCIVKNKFA
jgi:hypothetical protein